MERRFPGLSYFGGSYCNQDWREEYGTIEECLADFKQDSKASGVLDRALVDLGVILDSSMTDAELDSLWAYELHGAYDPTVDGLTQRQWFAQIRRFFAQ